LELQEKVIALAAGALLFAAVASGYGTLYATPKATRLLTELPGITAENGKMQVKPLELPPAEDALAEITGDAPSVDATNPPAAAGKADPKPAAKPAPAKPKASFPINLNTATVDTLDNLPGIGPTLAERIIAYRKQIGRFKSVEQLKNVKGIGDKKFADIKKLVIVK
jgi:competence ComEA-like helix-hairpin-helix protein